MKYLILLVFALPSCKVLTPTQTKAVESYASAAKTAAAMPAELHQKIYELHNQFALWDMYNALAQQPPDSVFIAKINEYTKTIDDNSQIVNQASSNFSVLNSLAQMMLAFTDSKYIKSFADANTDMGTSFETLISKYNSLKPDNKKIPTTITSLATKLIMSSGKLKLKQLQRKYLTQFLNATQPAFETICDDFINFDNKSITSLSDEIQKNADLNFSTYRMRIRMYDSVNAKSFPFIKENIFKVYQETQQKTAEIKSLIPLSKNIFVSLKQSFNSLQQAMKTKPSFAQLKTDFKELQKAAVDIKEAYKKFKNEKEQLQSTNK